MFNYKSLCCIMCSQAGTDNPVVSLVISDADGNDKIVLDIPSDIVGV